MSGIFGLFNLFSVIYIFRSLQLAAVVWREWPTLNQEPLTRRKKQLAEQASFFIAVPIGVFLHELGHALATWLFGGQVVEFGYRVFWGYVVPRGVFTPAQDWFISLAGTLGNLVFGVALWLLLRRHRATAIRFFALRAFRFQVYFGLIYYPVFTLLLSIGDWKTIYNFQATPILSGVTAVAHIALLGLFWFSDRVGRFEMPAHASVAEQEGFDALAAATAVNPQDARLQFQYINALHRGGAPNKARTHLNQFMKQNPNSAAAYLQLAALQAGAKSHVSRAARENVQKALRLGLSDTWSIALAHKILGQYYLDIGDGKQAITHLSQAIAAVVTKPAVGEKPTGKEPFYAHLHHLRSLAYRRQRQYDLAYQDIQQAIVQAQAAGDERLVAHYRDELEIVEKHAGRALLPSPTDWP